MNIYKNKIYVSYPSIQCNRQWNEIESINVEHCMNELSMQILYTYIFLLHFHYDFEPPEDNIGYMSDYDDVTVFFINLLNTQI